MKKLILILLCIGMLAGCKKDDQIKPAPTPDISQEEPQGTIKDYFPIKANTVYEYEGIGDINANQTSFVTYINGDTFQRRISNPAGIATEVLQYVDGELKLIYGDARYYFFEDLTQVKPNLDMILLKEPLVQGGKWAVNENAECEITNSSIEVETPYGTLNTLEVTMTYANGAVEKDYYAKGIGLIKIQHPSVETEKLSVLKSISEESGLQVPIIYYDANAVTNEQEVTTRSIIIQTNGDLLKALTETMKKTTSEDYVPLLTPDTTIRFIALDRQTSTATVDLSEAFVKESNNGDGIQSLILQCITNTVGNLYDVDKVVITVEDKPFKFGSIEKQEGEYFTVEKRELSFSELTEGEE